MNFKKTTSVLEYYVTDSWFQRQARRGNELAAEVSK